MTFEDDLTRLCALLAPQPDDVARSAVAGELAGWLYSYWYAKPAIPFASDPEQPPFDQLWSALDAVVDGAAPWTTEWIVLEAARDGSIVAGCRDMQRWAPVGRYASPDRPGLPVVPGERVSLAPLLSWADHNTGQWAAQSPGVPEEPLTRLYFNVAAGQVGNVVAAIATWLAERGTRFRMKCPGRAVFFSRVDALVLYLADADAKLELNGLDELLHSVTPLLREGTPPLALPLAVGIAMAEDPGEGSSFGQNRCGILAAAFENAWTRGCTPNPAELNDALAAAGLDPDAPWRRAK